MAKSKLNADVTSYFKDGCGRCKLHGTPECKVRSWAKELKRLRAIVLECDLVEERKWGVACYTFEEKNIAIVSALKDYCALSFFKGVLMSDPNKLLVAPGENSQSARLIKFTELDQINENESVLKKYIEEAIQIECSGQKVEFKAKTELVLPEELYQKFSESPELQSAFEALTPGRQRGYVLHFSAAKQSATRTSRIEKCIPAILAGKGMHD